MSIHVDLLHVRDPNKDASMAPHVGFNNRIVGGLLNVPLFRHMLARVLTMALCHREIDIFCLCSAGKHRSVAAVICLAYMIRKHSSPSAVIDVSHLEHAAWRASTCAGRCPECYGSDVSEYSDALDTVWNLVPYKKELKQVRRVCNFEE